MMYNFNIFDINCLHENILIGCYECKINMYYEYIQKTIKRSVCFYLYIQHCSSDNAFVLF